MTERILSQLQAAEMGIWRRVRGMTLRDKARSCKDRRALIFDLFRLRIERSQLRWFGRVSRNTGEENPAS